MAEALFTSPASPLERLVPVLFKDPHLEEPANGGLFPAEIPLVQVVLPVHLPAADVRPHVGGKSNIGHNIHSRRHRMVAKRSGPSQQAIRRLARRGGVKRISGMVYEETYHVLRTFLQDVLHDVIVYSEHARRKTVTCRDVVYALKKQGRTLYGF
jgi:histone H4